MAEAEEGAALRAALGAGPEIFVFNGHMAGDADRIRAAELVPLLNSPEQVARHLEAADRGPRLAEFVSLAAKLAVLEDERPDRELENSDEYRRLRKRANSLAEALEGEAAGLADAVAVRRALEEEEP